MESSASARPRTWWSSAGRAVCRWVWRNVVAVAQGLGVAGCRLAGIPVEGDPVPEHSLTAAIQPYAEGTAEATEPGVGTAAGERRPLSGPPPGHPERLVPPELALSPAEMELWCQLGGVIRWPM